MAKQTYSRYLLVWYLKYVYGSMVLLFLLGFAALIATNAGLQSWRMYSLKQEMMAYAVSEMPDPAAAQFRNIETYYVKNHLVHRPEWFMCGETNNKNKVGAYEGYKSFMVMFAGRDGQTRDVSSLVLCALFDGKTKDFDGVRLTIFEPLPDTAAR